MNIKKISMVAMVALMVLALSGVTADAGVGGCRRLGSCGSYDAAAVKVVRQAPVTPSSPSFLDSLSFIIPADILAAGKAFVNGGRNSGSTTEGVGGCRRLGTCGSWQ